MEQKIKNQYSYLIYPYIVEEKNYEEYILRLLENKNCKIKLWNKQKDLALYTYLNQGIRDNLFWSFNFSNEKKNKLNELDNDLKSKLISQYETVMFEYNIGDNLQAKIGEDGTELFEINKIEIMCFKTGICLLIIKTSLGRESNLAEVLNFNNKIRTLGSDFKTTTEESIRIQSNDLMDVIDLSEIFKHIIGTNKEAKTSKILEERFLTYSYTCIDDKNWDSEFDKENFMRLYKVLSSDAEVANKDEYEKNIIEYSKYLKVGFSKQGTGIISSGIDSENSFKMPYVFEQEYLYTYLLTLYKKLIIQKIKLEYEENKKFDKTKEQLEEFSKNILAYKITNDKQGIIMLDKWEETLQTEYLFEKLKATCLGRF